MSTKAKIKKVRNEVQAHEDRGWLKGYEEGLAVREEQTVTAQNANEKLKARIKELESEKPAPKTAREALDLAWELAHPVKDGQIIPVGTEFFYKNAHKVLVEEFSFKITASTVRSHRTLDPLPDTEPDWLDAPAVLATCPNYNGGSPAIYAPRVASDRWSCSECGEHARWQDLRDVTPLYPKGQDA